MNAERTSTRRSDESCIDEGKKTRTEIRSRIVKKLEAEWCQVSDAETLGVGRRWSVEDASMAVNGDEID